MSPKTLLKFDERGLTEPVVTSKATLLIEAVLEEYCSIYTQNQERQSHCLFQALRKLFTQWNVLPSDSLPADKRIKYRHYLRRIVTLTMQQICEQEKDSVDGDFQNKVANPAEELPEVYLERQLTATSRLEAEYTDIEYLAKGGFGRVFRAKHILDGNIYAIKSVPIKTGEKSRIWKTLREIQTLAKLHHPNVVSYKNAWLEVGEPELPLRLESGPQIVELSTEQESDKVKQLKPLRLRRKASKCTTENHGPEIESLEGPKVNFGDGEVPGGGQSELSSGQWSSDLKSESGSDLFSEKCVTKSNSSSAVLPDIQRLKLPECKKTSSGGSSIVFDSGGGDAKDKGESDNSRKSSELKDLPINKSNLMLPPVNLYIAMQFCDGTLRDWLRQRDRSSSLVDASVSFRIFGQIVEGLKYIHDNGIVHRDLKPENIFFNHSVRRVQIGDFGLARFLPGSGALPLTPLALPSVEDSRLTRGLGTQSYAAPEQIAGGKYDNKCDIYSLGFILVELFEKFFTDFSRYRCFQELRKGVTPQSLSQRRPLVAELVLEMTDKCPEARPSASELLQRIRFVYTSSLETECRALTLVPSELELD